MRPAEVIPQSTSWVIGWKFANVYVAPDMRTLRFVPIHQDGLIEPYSVDDTATCQQRGDHRAPAQGCRCGFNAWHESNIAHAYYDQASRQSDFLPHQLESIALLRVGLYGDVVEGTANVGRARDVWGYRSSRQRVSELFFEKQCKMLACDHEAELLGLMKQGVFGWLLHPLCSSHVQQAQCRIDTLWLGQQNGVTVHWHYPSE